MRNKLMITVFTGLLLVSCSQRKQDKAETEKINQKVIRDAKVHTERTEAIIDSIMSTVDLESSQRIREESKRLLDSLENVKKIIHQGE